MRSRRPLRGAVGPPTSSLDDVEGHLVNDTVDDPPGTDTRAWRSTVPPRLRRATRAGTGRRGSRRARCRCRMARPACGCGSGRCPRTPRRRRRWRRSAGTGRRDGSRSGSATRPRCASARSGAGLPPSPADRSPMIRPHASLGDSDLAWSMRAWTMVAGSARSRDPGARPSPPVDAALERVLHLVERGRERAGREVLPTAVGQQRDDGPLAHP